MLALHELALKDEPYQLNLNSEINADLRIRSSCGTGTIDEKHVYRHFFRQIRVTDYSTEAQVVSEMLTITKLFSFKHLGNS